MKPLYPVDLTNPATKNASSTAKSNANYGLYLMDQNFEVWRLEHVIAYQVAQFGYIIQMSQHTFSGCICF